MATLERELSRAQNAGDLDDALAIKNLLTQVNSGTAEHAVATTAASSDDGQTNARSASGDGLLPAIQAQSTAAASGWLAATGFNYGAGIAPES